MNSKDRCVVVIGASSGGVSALLELAATLPRFFPAPVCVVLHVGNNPSLLPDLLRHHGTNHAMHAQDGMHLSASTLYVAPPDHHMLLDGLTVRLTRGPKENHARPAIDPLFRTAALTGGPRVIGVILTGQMDDGTAGLQAIKACGGIAIVQDPLDAAEPEMPRSALAHVEVDHCVPLARIPSLLAELVGQPAADSAPPPESLVREVAINRGEHSVDNLATIANVSPITCPDCHGSLWEMRAQKPLRYRCHLGHAYTALTLLREQGEQAEDALWSGVRALREREMLLRRFAAIAESSGDAPQAAAGRAQAERLHARIERLIAAAQDQALADEGAAAA